MEVYALYGSSGTGKSSSALELAHRLEIEAIIDDGILIYQGRKVAGTSAKYEKTKIQAVKRAIFFYPDHTEEVKRIMGRLPISRLLVIGTSKRMIERIVTTLELPAPARFISIESIKPAQEIKAARYIRETQGKHVIPVPRVEVEKDFFQRIIASAQQIFSTRKEVIGETTIVQPAFSGGRIQVYEHVLKKIVQAACLRFTEVAQVHKSTYTFHDLPRLSVNLTLSVPFGTAIRPIVRQLQQALYDELDYCLNIAPASIDVTIQSVQIEASLTSK
ncbi:hypothetical protein ACI7RC_13625 [Brevibacillus sp. B_LB10_24]|uniref:hypothetical protein n=1 Tax=Brevibacillus sp. B_LB10_24 TaxID=3380645 RepID=UPI0038B90083